MGGGRLSPTRCGTGEAGVMVNVPFHLETLPIYMPYCYGIEDSEDQIPPARPPANPGPLVLPT
jgi:hypothetical protein